MTQNQKTKLNSLEFTISKKGRNFCVNTDSELKPKAPMGFVIKSALCHLIILLQCIPSSLSNTEKLIQQTGLLYCTPICSKPKGY